MPNAVSQLCPRDMCTAHPFRFHSVAFISHVTYPRLGDVPTTPHQQHLEVGPLTGNVWFRFMVCAFGHYDRGCIMWFSLSGGGDIGTVSLKFAIAVTM